MWNETIGDFTGEDALESKKVKAFSSPLRTECFGLCRKIFYQITRDLNLDENMYQDFAVL